MKPGSWLTIAVVSGVSAVLLAAAVIWLPFRWAGALVIFGAAVFLAVLFSNPAYFYRRLAFAIVTLWMSHSAIAGFAVTFERPDLLTKIHVDSPHWAYHMTVAGLVIFLLYLDFLTVVQSVAKTTALEANKSTGDDASQDDRRVENRLVELIEKIIEEQRRKTLWVISTLVFIILVGGLALSFAWMQVPLFGGGIPINPPPATVPSTVPTTSQVEQLNPRLRLILEISVDKEQQSGTRLSGNFSLTPPADAERLVWVVEGASSPESVRFALKRDRAFAEDPTLIAPIGNNMSTAALSGNDLYLAYREGADPRFTVKVYAE